MQLRYFTKNKLLELLGMTLPAGGVNHPLYKKQFTDDFIVNKLQMEVSEFKNAKQFTYDQTQKIQSFFNFTEDEIKS